MKYFLYISRINFYKNWVYQYRGHDKQNVYHKHTLSHKHTLTDIHFVCVYCSFKNIILNWCYFLHGREWAPITAIFHGMLKIIDTIYFYVCYKIYFR